MEDMPRWITELTTKMLNAQKEPEIFLCPKCGSRDHQQSHDPLVLLQAKVGKPITFNKGIWLAMMACQNCGFVELRSLNALGIDPTE